MIATCPRCATSAIQLPSGDYLFPCRCGTEPIILDDEISVEGDGSCDDISLSSSLISVSGEDFSSFSSSPSSSDIGLLRHILMSLRFRGSFYESDFGSRYVSYFFHFLSGFLLACSFYLLLFFSFPEHVVRILPGSILFYDYLGVRVLVSDFELRDIVLTKQVGLEPVSLTIEGRVLNRSGLGRIIPNIHYSLHDENGQSLYSWSHPVESPVLGPGGSSSFSTRLSSFPDYASFIRVRFSDRHDFDSIDIR